VSPAAVQNLQAEVEDGAVIVSWLRPARTTDGGPLADPGEFRLSRAIQTPAEREADRQPLFAPLATVRADEPENATVLGDRYAFRDAEQRAESSAESVIAYRVEPVSRSGRVGPPATVSLSTGPTAGPPTGVSVRPGDGAVELTWSAPSDGPAVRGYNVYRGTETGLYGPAPLNSEPLRERQFRDGTLTNGVTYYYVVRSVTGDAAPYRQSRNSAEVVGTPEDRTPPAPPMGLAAVPFAGGVALVWDASTEADLLGYMVYRREPETVTPTRLTPTPVRAATFTDRAVRPGATYLYSVTAVDRSPRQNESAPSAEADASIP
jgi:hypothetical protein